MEFDYRTAFFTLMGLLDGGGAWYIEDIEDEYPEFVDHYRANEEAE